MPPGWRVLRLGKVKIIVDVTLDENGRAVGSVRRAGHTARARAFSGNLEFLALIENLYRTERDDPDDAGSNEKERS